MTAPLDAAAQALARRYWRSTNHSHHDAGCLPREARQQLQPGETIEDCYARVMAYHYRQDAIDAAKAFLQARAETGEGPPRVDRGTIRILAAEVARAQEFVLNGLDYPRNIVATAVAPEPAGPPQPPDICPVCGGRPSSDRTYYSDFPDRGPGWATSAVHREYVCGAAVTTGWEDPYEKPLLRWVAGCPQAMPAARAAIENRSQASGEG